MLLLIFELVPETIEFYVMDGDHPQSENARKSDGIYINDASIGYDHPIFALYGWLDTNEAKSMRVKTPYKGSITEFYHCGFLL